MTAQQQEPTMREEQTLAEAIYTAWTGQTYWGGCDQRESVERVLAVLERHGDDDAARVRRVRELAEELEAESFGTGRGVEAKAVSYSAADRIRRALDGDDTGSGQ